MSLYMWKVRWKVNHGLAVGVRASDSPLLCVDLLVSYSGIILRLYDNFIVRAN